MIEKKRKEVSNLCDGDNGSKAQIEIEKVSTTVELEKEKSESNQKLGSQNLNVLEGQVSENLESERKKIGEVFDQKPDLSRLTEQEKEGEINKVDSNAGDNSSLPIQDNPLSFDIIGAIERIKKEALKRYKVYSREKIESFRKDGESKIGLFRNKNKKKSKFFLFVLGFLQFLLVFVTVFTITFVVLQPEFVLRNIDYYINKEKYKENEKKILIPLDERNPVREKELFIIDSPAPIGEGEDFSRNRIVIPSINVDAPISIPKDSSEKSINEALKEGVVHFPNTSFFGENGNIFLTGHSSNYIWEQGKYNTVFVNLGKLQIGDRIIVYFNQKKYVYKVFRKFEVWPSETWVLSSNPRGKVDKNFKDKPNSLLTLMTCTPVGTNLKRLIVWAEEDPEYMNPTRSDAPIKNVEEKPSELPKA